MENVKAARMSRKRLERLRTLRVELDAMAKRLTTIEKEASFYRGVSPGEGKDVQEMRDAILSRCHTEEVVYARRRKTLEQETELLIGFIDSIQDSVLRQVFALRYLDGLTWQQISNRMNGINADTLRVKHNRFLDKHSPHGKEWCA